MLSGTFHVLLAYRIRKKLNDTVKKKKEKKNLFLLIFFHRINKL